MSEEKVLAHAEDGENHENDDVIAQHAAMKPVLSTPGRKSRKERYG